MYVRLCVCIHTQLHILCKSTSLMKMNIFSEFVAVCLSLQVHSLNSTALPSNIIQSSAAILQIRCTDGRTSTYICVFNQPFCRCIKNCTCPCNCDFIQQNASLPLQIRSKHQQSTRTTLTSHPNSLPPHTHFYTSKSNGFKTLNFYLRLPLQSLSTEGTINIYQNSDDIFLLSKSLLIPVFDQTPCRLTNVILLSARLLWNTGLASSMNNPCSRGEQVAHKDFDYTATIVFVRILLGAWSYIVNNTDKFLSCAYRTQLLSNPLKPKV